MSEQRYSTTLDEVLALRSEVASLRAQLAAYANENTNLRNDLVLLGMAKDSEIASARKAAIEECAAHVEACGFKYSAGGFDVADNLRRLALTDEQQKDGQ